jgi:hypothetical protein
MNVIWKARGRKALVWTLRILAGIVALPLLYFLAALVLGLIPANVSFHQPAEGGVVIYIRSNGIHTDIVMPKVNAEADCGLMPIRPMCAIRAGARPTMSRSAMARANSISTPRPGGICRSRSRSAR